MPPLTDPLIHQFVRRFVIVFGFLAVAFCAGLAQFYWRRSQRSKAVHWPFAEGRVEVADVGERAWWDLAMNLQGRSPRNVAALGYSYSVAGTVYSGTYKREFEDENDAWDFARKFKGRAVSVQYNPEKASRSVLFEESLDSLQPVQPSIAFLGSASPRQSLDGTQQAPAPTAMRRNPWSVWRIASWIVLAIALLELWRLEEILRSKPLASDESRSWIVLAIVTLAISKICNLVSHISQRK
jgi:hypothetical protein